MAKHRRIVTSDRNSRERQKSKETTSRSHLRSGLRTRRADRLVLTLLMTNLNNADEGKLSGAPVLGRALFGGGKAVFARS